MVGRPGARGLYYGANFTRFFCPGRASRNRIGSVRLNAPALGLWCAAATLLMRRGRMELRFGLRVPQHRPTPPSLHFQHEVFRSNRLRTRAWALARGRGYHRSGSSLTRQVLPRPVRARPPSLEKARENRVDFVRPLLHHLVPRRPDDVQLGMPYQLRLQTTARVRVLACLRARAGACSERASSAVVILSDSPLMITVRSVGGTVISAAEGQRDCSHTHWRAHTRTHACAHEPAPARDHTVGGDMVSSGPSGVRAPSRALRAAPRKRAERWAATAEAANRHRSSCTRYWEHAPGINQGYPAGFGTWQTVQPRSKQPRSKQTKMCTERAKRTTNVWRRGGRTRVEQAEHTQRQ